MPAVVCRYSGRVQPSPNLLVHGALLGELDCILVAVQVEQGMQHRLVEFVRPFVGSVNGSIVLLGLAKVSFGTRAEGQEMPALVSLRMPDTNLFGFSDVSLPPGEPSVVEG